MVPTGPVPEEKPQVSLGGMGSAGNVTDGKQSLKTRSSNLPANMQDNMGPEICGKGGRTHCGQGSKV